MSWLRIVVDANRDEGPAIETVLEQHAAVSVSFEDRADEPVFELQPGETPLWSEIRVTGLFPENTSAQDILAAIESSLGHALVASRVEKLADQDWERVWLDRFQPTQVGDNLWICPTHMDPPDPDAVTVFIDPGLAFGSGTHPTTAMCLEWLSRQDLGDRTVLDYGCGSGILAIAALKLGAREAWGVDIDPRALKVTRENAVINNVSGRLRTCLPDDLAVKDFDVLVANILSGPLIALAGTFHALLIPNGLIALSGILATQADEVANAYTTGFRLAGRQRDGWTLLSGARV
ncbi:MAG: 50S ribosomal protein L11 methyltransferase [Acidiferrobacterales bacterium]